jgi:UDP-N-acetylglucosamine 4,6-dehydratase/UDP-glucose 4-epimerase
MEKLFITASNYLKNERHKTKFIALRYGNVLGSSGSVIPKFINQIKNNGKITITDPNMTRFSISMDEALDFILKVTEIGKGSEIFVPKLKAYSLMDVKDALFDLLGKTDEEIVGIRPGEKVNEVLINKDEMKYCWEYQDMYLITNPSVRRFTSSTNEFPGKKKIESMEVYSSDAVEKIPKEELKKIFTDLGLIG